MQKSVFLVKSQMLDRLHGEVMTLIDRLSLYRQKKTEMQAETHNCTPIHAAYLNRLFIRLHNTAFLLLLNRAERDGDMRTQEAARQRAKIALTIASQEKDQDWQYLPEEFRKLESQSLTLEKQLVHLMKAERGSAFNQIAPHQQWQQIEAAFATETEILQGKQA